MDIFNVMLIAREKGEAYIIVKGIKKGKECENDIKKRIDNKINVRHTLHMPPYTCYIKN